MYKKKIQTKYDRDLMIINGLKQLPWIGKGYNQKLLVIGSHHYEKEKQELKFEDKEYTRNFIKETAINNKNKHIKFIHSFNKLLLKTDSQNIENFWNKTAFYNFVQRVLLNKKESRNNRDFEQGWPIFIKIIEIIEPEVCLFLSKGLSHKVKENLTNYEFKLLENNNFHKITEVKINNKITKLIFIPSPIINQKKNKIFLNSEIPEYF